MFLRVVIWLAVVLLDAAPAWAEGTAPDPSSLVRDYGGWGLSSLFATVIGVLWLKNQKLTEDMSELLTKRGDDAESRAERFAVVATTATNAILTGAEAAREVKQKQDAVLDAVRLLPPAIEVVAKGVDRNAGMLDAALTRHGNGGGR